MQPITLISMLGRPGSGKDTQIAKFLETVSNSACIYPGQIVRESADPAHPFHVALAPARTEIDQGLLISNPEPINAVVRAELHRHIHGGKTTIVFSGFPRVLSQLPVLEEWRTELGAKGLLTESYFVHLAAPVNLVEERLHRRGGVEFRHDDNPSLHKTRHEQYRNFSLEVSRALHRAGQLLVVRGDGSEEVVFQRITRALREARAHNEEMLPIRPTKEGRLRVY